MVRNIRNFDQELKVGCFIDDGQETFKDCQCEYGPDKFFRFFHDDKLVFQITPTELEALYLSYKLSVKESIEYEILINNKPTK